MAAKSDRRVWTEERLNALRAMAAAGIPQSEAARRIGVSQTAVGATASKYGISFCAARWGDSRIERITGRIRQGIPLKALAMEEGVSKSTLRAVLQRRGIRPSELRPAKPKKGGPVNAPPEENTPTSESEQSIVLGRIIRYAAWAMENTGCSAALAVDKVLNCMQTGQLDW